MNEELKPVLARIKNVIIDNTGTVHADRIMVPLYWYLKTGRSDERFNQMLESANRDAEEEIAGILIDYDEGDYNKIVYMIRECLERNAVKDISDKRSV